MRDAGASTLRLVLVEDSADDADLTQIELAEAGLDVACRRVEDAAGLREALQAFPPDIVVSDLNLPGFSGEQALALVRELAPGVPFVYFSGQWPPAGPPRPAGDGDGPPALCADGCLLKTQWRELPDLVKRLVRPA